MYKSKSPMLNLPDRLAAEIEQVTEFQIDELIQAVIRQYNNLHPEQEGVFLALPREPREREKELAQITKFLHSPEIAKPPSQ